MKICPRCKRDLPTESFGHRSGVRSHRLRSRCHECESEIAGQYGKENRAKVRTQQNARSLRWLYNLTPADVERMFAEQGGLCACCRDPITLIIGQPGYRRIDHDHAKEYAPGRCQRDAVRGLLCCWCNCMIGNAKESQARLDAGKVYLEAHAQ